MSSFVIAFQFILFLNMESYFLKVIIIFYLFFSKIDSLFQISTIADGIAHWGSNANTVKLIKCSNLQFPHL